MTPPKSMLPPKGTVDSRRAVPLRRRAPATSPSISTRWTTANPFLFKTTDYGKTWKALGAGIPKSPLSLRPRRARGPVPEGTALRGDRERPLRLVRRRRPAGEPLQSKLPHAPVYWLTVEPRFHDLVVATYGRGFYILDDVTAARGMERECPRIGRSSFRSRAGLSLPRGFAAGLRADRDVGGQERAGRSAPRATG